MALATPLYFRVKADWSNNLSLSLEVTGRTIGMDWLVICDELNKNY